MFFKKWGAHLKNYLFFKSLIIKCVILSHIEVKPRHGSLECDCQLGIFWGIDSRPPPKLKIFFIFYKCKINVYLRYTFITLLCATFSNQRNLSAQNKLVFTCEMLSLSSWPRWLKSTFLVIASEREQRVRSSLVHTAPGAGVCSRSIVLARPGSISHTQTWNKWGLFFRWIFLL